MEGYQPNMEITYKANNRNELKKIYNNIINLNKRSPFYKINLSKENQEYAIGVKEMAISLKSKIGEMSDPMNAAFNSKAVSVSNNQVLSAELISEDTDSLPQNIELTVKSVATRQINKGRVLLKMSRGLPPGTYDFRAEVMGKSYPLTFVQPERQENRESMQRMTDFINKSVPGITASVEQAEKADYSSIMITSDFTGTYGERAFIFEDENVLLEGVIDYFGLDRLEVSPCNAEFELNGMRRQTASNTFSLENTIQVALQKTSDSPVNLRIVPDRNPILDEVDSFLRKFNGLIRLSKSRTEDTEVHLGAVKLNSELKSLEKVYQNELEACGLMASEQGYLDLDDALAIQAAEDGGMESLFTRENGFIARVFDKAAAITINPIEYLDKTVVTYPNTKKVAYANPYMTSVYSGLLFNSYC
jgi:flagellar hook-associated protein 2